MTENETQQNPAAAATPPELRLTCPPFDPARLRRQMALDAAYRWGVFIVVVVVLSLGSVLDPSAGHLALLVLVGMVAAWFWLSINSARAMALVNQASLLIEQDPIRAETLLAQALKRWPMQRPLRIMLYHRLAVLRHRQQHYAEAAAIGQELLTFNLAGAERGAGAGWLAGFFSRRGMGPLRANLLLMVVECRLYLRDLGGAYQGLMELHGASLGLLESLQRMALQTRYEIMAGYYPAALADLPHKIQMAELMPPAHCGAMHAMLAVAARAVGKEDLATWLRQRTELLCTPEQLRALGVE